MAIFKTKNLFGYENYKTTKGEARNWLTAIMYLAPYDLSGKQVCGFASKGCASACLNTAGRGVMTPVKKGRLHKTLFWFQFRQEFKDLIAKNLKSGLVKAKNKGMKLCARPNGTSDIPFEKLTTMMQDNPNIQFYDYTANPYRAIAWAKGKLPVNYHLTFSLKEDNIEHAQKVLQAGGNVAVVFRHTLPKTYLGFRVINGDEHDLRFLDDKNVIVGLTAKGKAKKDTTGFVKDIEESLELAA